ncbi:tafazzin-like [Actinia tenebrosa]|uniref:Tafazzin family protein n=1 Tax=Actinia tenebrosa TaxID=6105 RepID=A0A6P8HEI6_ACTTE|nr:tafazzin-like [Actinia tenebrosa]
MCLTTSWPFCRVAMEKISWKIESSVIVAAVGGASNLWLKWLNTVRVHNQITLDQCTADRPDGVPLVTVSNHYSCLDDPLMWGILKLKVLFSREKQRWTLGAKELLFSKPLHAFLFSRGKVIPVVRGEGVYQKGVDFALEQLNQGQWVHVFPEGKVIEDGSLVRLKWGVGRLIAESKVTPIVLPLWHVGMDDILPNQKPYIPQIMKKVTVLVGEPIKFEDILKDYQKRKKSATEARKHITDVIQCRFKELKEEAEFIHSKWS